LPRHKCQRVDEHVVSADSEIEIVYAESS
jgi:hypothetical protein